MRAFALVSALVGFISFRPFLASADESRAEVAIEVSPRRAFGGAVVHLRARLIPMRAETDETNRVVFSWSWTADAGRLLSDDLAEVEWRAPSAAGEYRLRVSARSGDREVVGSAMILVERPSTEGMVWIPPGPFLQGDVAGTLDTKESKTIQNSADEPAHRVILDGYWIDRFPITHGRYAEFLEEYVALGLGRVTPVAVFGRFEGSEVPLYYFRNFEELIRDYRVARNARRAKFRHWISEEGGRFRVLPGKEAYSVVNVTWFGAAAYAAFHGKRLPSESEWERAARGVDGRRYPWGDSVPTPYHGAVGAGESYGFYPVGHFSPASDAPSGAADMLSGVFEWTNDWFQAELYQDNSTLPPPGFDSTASRPVLPFWGRSHSIRGAPSALQYPKGSVDPEAAVAFRYSWRFEFLLGNAFANRETSFRTALPSGLFAAPFAPSSPADRAPAPHGDTLTGPEACGVCHPRHYEEWRGSMHAYSSVDPIVKSLNKKALEDTKGALERFCADCHAPLGVRTGELPRIPLDLAAGPRARSGVSCEFCHKVEGPETDRHPSNNSLLWRDGNTVFGGLDDPTPTEAHASVTSRFTSTSDFCGRCHDVRVGEVLVERTYAQWSASIHRRRSDECQDCHMTRYSGRAAKDGPFREELHRHDFPGVSVPAPPFPHRGRTLERTEEVLRGALRLVLFAPGEANAGEPLAFTVAVKNVGAGHNIPSGISGDRQLWLEVMATDAAGRLLFSSGRVDADGELPHGLAADGRDADPFLASFSDRFLAADGTPTFFLWETARVESRSLEPLEQRNLAYRFDLPRDLEGSSVRLRVRALYRSFAPHVLHGLGLEGEAARPPIREMAREDSGPIRILAEATRPTEYHVPGDFESVGVALRALRDGDTITVGPGVHPIRESLDFLGKGIRLRSREGRDRTTLLWIGGDDAEAGSLAVFRGGETRSSVLEGFTLKGGRGSLVDGLRRGGGILVRRSSPTIRDNRILECSAALGVGGGIALEDASPLFESNEILSSVAGRGGAIAATAGAEVLRIERSRIEGNTASEGGAVYLDGSARASIASCILAGNRAWKRGGAVLLGPGASLDLERSTIVHHRSDREGGTIALEEGASWGGGHCIFWDNSPPVDARALAHSLGEDVFPVFRDPTGRWEARSDPPSDAGPEARDAWRGGDYRLLPASPAIDAGSPELAPDPDDSRADLGALFFERPLRGFIRGDVDLDGRVGLPDAEALAAFLFAGSRPRCLDAADVDDTGRIDPADLSRLLGFFLCRGPPPAPPFPDCGIDPSFGEGLSCESRAPGCP